MNEPSVISQEQLEKLISNMQGAIPLSKIATILQLAAKLQPIEKNSLWHSLTDIMKNDRVTAQSQLVQVFEQMLSDRISNVIAALYENDAPVPKESNMGKGKIFRRVG